MNSNNFGFESFNSVRASELEFDVPQVISNGENEVIHDDGFMHVHFNGMSYAFNIGQEVSSSQYNRQANQILREIGVSGTVTGRNN